MGYWNAKLSDIQPFTNHELEQFARGSSLNDCIAHRAEHRIRYGVSILNQDDKRCLLGPNWSTSLWDTPALAQAWLDAARPDLAARIARHETCQINAFDCYWHGEAIGIFVEPFLQNWKKD